MKINSDLKALLKATNELARSPAKGIKHFRQKKALAEAAAASSSNEPELYPDPTKQP